MAEWADLLLGQLTDPFRVGLVIALVVTAVRTEAVTGRVLPLLAGLAFVAVIIPTTMPSSGGASVIVQVATGLVANAILLAIVLGIRRLVLPRR
jgi:hypothetical protein